MPARTLIGYVCSTLSPASSLTHDSMEHHVPDAASVCIHSVCVSSAHRGKRVGVHLLREYVSRLESTTRDDNSKAYERALLITHGNLRDFYEEAGFEWAGESHVVHGSQPWFEMRKEFGPVPDSQPSMPPGLWDALNRPVENRPVPQSLSSLNITDLCIDGANKHDLLCPQAKCASVILKAGVAKMVERTAVQANLYQPFTRSFAKPAP